MSDDPTFADFVQRIRAGDTQAAAELVRRYEPAIRMEVRLRLVDKRLRRVLDTMDVCQSVLGSFFIRAATGLYELDEPDQLVKLLVAMARNKVAHQARRQRALRRDVRREIELNSKAIDVPTAQPSPSRVIEGQELLGELRRRLTDEERRLGDLRAQGFEWTEIAVQLGGTSQARRKQWNRAVGRVAQELGLDESGDE